MPSRIIYVANKSVTKLFNYFSIDLLLKTLFLPWKRDEVDMTNMSLDDRLRVMLMNLISRLVGAVVRTGTIFVGTLSIIATALSALVALILFVASPLLALALIIGGILI